MWGGQQSLGWAGPREAWQKALTRKPRRVQGLQQEPEKGPVQAHESGRLYERSLTSVTLGPSVDLGMAST